jgi:hypothetical protein
VDAGVIALSIPIVAIIAGAAVKIAHLWAPPPRTADPDLTMKVEAMEQDLAALRQELAETQERLDFTERLLAKPPERGGSPGG